MVRQRRLPSASFRQSSHSTDLITGLTAHLDAHISETRHHTGASVPPGPPSYHPPTGYWTATGKALFFHVHSRFRSDLIASSIGTKSQLDIIIYLDLLHSGAQKLTAVRGAIARDQLPTAYEVSDTFVKLEDTQAASLTVAEPLRTDESCAAARAMRNSMRLRKGEGAAHAHAHVRDRACQQARREVYGGQEGVWAREDVLARLDGVAQQAFDRMLRVDEEPVVVVTNPNHEDEDVDALANLSPASRRRIDVSICVESELKRAVMSAAQLDPARLKS